MAIKTAPALVTAFDNAISCETSANAMSVDHEALIRS
jgi:hypothetical protein